MASLMNKPLKSIYNTKSSDLFLQPNCFKPKFLNLKKPFVTSIVCKAVTTKPDSQLQALNIADDVTQVIHTLPCMYISLQYSPIFCLFGCYLVPFVDLCLLKCFMLVDGRRSTRTLS